MKTKPVAVLLVAVALFLLPLLLSSPPADAPPADAYFSAEQLARMEAYHAVRTPLSLGAWILGLVVTLLIAVGPTGRALGSWASRICRGRWLRTAVLLASVASLVPAMAVLPLTVLRHRHDRAYGLATDDTLSALRDVAVASLVALGLAVVAAVGFMAMVRLAPRRWPVVVGASGSVMLVVLVLLFPVVYEPLFNDFAEVGEPTRSRISALADEAGVPVDQVLVADASRRTTRNNAYVSGIGSTRRVVLFDTLLEGAPEQEVDLVVAHELAHVRNDDVRNGTLLGVIGIIGGVMALAILLRSRAVLDATGASGPHDPRIVPAIFAFVALAGVVTLPVQNAVSRRAEAQADRFAIQLTNDAETQIQLEKRLALTNLSKPSPPRLLHLIFGTHPTTMERIGIALEAARSVPADPRS
ncbi:MAG: M48 family metalloprotease [Actinomycetota bacterium]